MMVSNRALRFGAGTFYISEQIVLQNATLCGYGDNQTTIRYNGPPGQPFVIAYGNSYIQDVYLSGNGVASEVVRAGDDAYGTAQLKMTNVTARYGEIGLFVRRSQISHFVNCTIQNNTNAGIHAETDDGTHKNTANTFVRCTISGNGVGVVLRNALTTTLTDCVIQQNASGGLAAYVSSPNRVRWLRLNDCYFERNGAYNLQLIGEGWNLFGEVALYNTYYAPEASGGALQFRNVRGVSMYESIPNGTIDILPGTHNKRRIDVFTHTPEVWPVEAAEEFVIK